jgi:hypothetical protein
MLFSALLGGLKIRRTGRSFSDISVIQLFCSIAPVLYLFHSGWIDPASDVVISCIQIAPGLSPGTTVLNKIPRGFSPHPPRRLPPGFNPDFWPALRSVAERAPVQGLNHYFRSFRGFALLTRGYLEVTPAGLESRCPWISVDDAKRSPGIRMKIEELRISKGIARRIVLVFKIAKDDKCVSTRYTDMRNGEFFL